MNTDKALHALLKRYRQLARDAEAAGDDDAFFIASRRGDALAGIVGFRAGAKAKAANARREHDAGCWNDHN